jgi:hypothetical protein
VSRGALVLHSCQHRFCLSDRWPEKVFPCGCYSSGHVRRMGSRNAACFKYLNHLKVCLQARLSAYFLGLPVVSISYVRLLSAGDTKASDVD